MTNEQAKRLDAAIEKAGLNWWEVQRKVGFDVFNDTEAIEITIAAIERMAKTETTEETTTEVKRYTTEDVEKAVEEYFGTDCESNNSFLTKLKQEAKKQKEERKRGMNLTLADELQDAIDLYNDEVDEDDYIYWWDVLNEMNDLTDDEEVLRVIMEIEQATKLIAMRRTAG